MGNIVLLDDLTINKIAAGEVIERPASVVKEMVENSIDAGAKNITVEIKNGGISLIKITDDGHGIAEDDMEIAFERHATSKIRKAEDLETVKSMGFRGEALASIAAIAKVEMISKKEGTDVAHKIVVEGGKTLEFCEAARSVGTTITVQNLFYNTPVRYKFLKKDYTEAGYIEDAVTRIALVNKDIAIKLISNGKTVVQTNGNGDLKTVIYSIYGKDVAAEIIELDYNYEDIKITGVIGKPVIARGNRANQLFFLNGRYIKDKNLTAAADQSYKGMIPIGRYGFIVLNIEMDPKLVDVNVHPAKLEVRFEEESKVFKAVYHAIKSSLAKSELVEHVKDENENVKINEVEKEANVEKEEVTNDFDTPVKEEKPHGFSGLFQKIMREPDEKESEINNNTLEEIFKYRQGLKNEGYQAATTVIPTVAEEYDGTPITNMNVSETTSNYTSDDSMKVINNDVADKRISLGDTLISSDTRELDVNVVNGLIKDMTTEMLSTKFAEKQATQTINTEDVRNEEMDKTQIIDIEKEMLSRETIINSNDVLEKTSQNTIILNNEEVSNDNVEEDSDDAIGFASIAEKLVEAKLGLDNTQMIDTAKVREALKESSAINSVDNTEGTIELNPEFDEMYKKTFGIDTVAVRKEKELENLEKESLNASKDFAYATSENMNVFEEKETEVKPQYKFLGIAFSTYIIIELKNEMYIIDQHAAHERIMYEKVKANYYDEGERDEQFLLLPDVISLTHKEMIIAKENINMFNRAGFSFEEFGENTIKLMSVPSMCEDLNTKQLFLDILDEIDTVAVTARQEKEDKFIATIACKAAVKAKMKLDEQEVKALMEELLELPNPFTCPHGRPTAIKMTKIDLEKKFSRR